MTEYRSLDLRIAPPLAGARPAADLHELTFSEQLGSAGSLAIKASKELEGGPENTVYSILADINDTSRKDARGWYVAFGSTTRSAAFVAGACENGVIEIIAYSRSAHALLTERVNEALIESHRRELVLEHPAQQIYLRAAFS